MGTGQRKFSAVMIEIHMVPTGGIMTGGTVCAKISVVIDVLLMAGIAIHWRTFKLLIDMT
jgi:hypothetical protein